MVIYLDIAFLLNCVADAAALYVTAQVAGLRLPRTRLILAAALGGVYGIVCAFPPMAFAASLLPQLLAAAGVLWRLPPNLEHPPERPEAGPDPIQEIQEETRDE